ncbi:biopolymer transporter TolR [Methylophaga sp. 41_12_T18]|nr:biopolymer transporter TolR [Methylophaga sp. 41_12_T18]
MLLDINHAQRRKAISLTPLIDVVFILLLFFMLTSTFTQWQQINLLTPAESDNQTPVLRVIKLESNNGLVSFEGRKLNSSNKKLLTAFIAEDSKATYIITVAKGIKTQAAVSLLDNLKQSGASQVSLAGVMP